MILEERDYRLKPGMTAQFLKNYEENGLPIQRDHLGQPVGFFTVEIGELNHVISLWRYEDLTDRAARREKMAADPRWRNYLGTVGGMIDTQSIRILNPCSFAPLDR